MKFSLCLLFVLSCLPGCSVSELEELRRDLDVDALGVEAIDLSELEVRDDGHSYAPGEESPYSGWARTVRSSGQLWSLRRFEDGELNGLSIWYHQSGDPGVTGIYRDGELLRSTLGAD